MALSTPDKLRALLEKRRETAATSGLQKIPFVLDQGLADKVERLTQQRHQVQERVDYFTELVAERMDDEPGVDVRASGHDMTDEGRQLAAAQVDLQRLTEELQQATDEAREGIVHLVFRRATAPEYERTLIDAGGADVDSDTAASLRFHDALTRLCFVRVEMDGADAGIADWDEFCSTAGLTFGEVDPIRAVVYAMNRRSGNSVPF